METILLKNLPGKFGKCKSCNIKAIMNYYDIFTDKYVQMKILTLLFQGSTQFILPPLFIAAKCKISKMAIDGFPLHSNYLE